MKRSLTGGWLPESHADALQLAQESRLNYTYCMRCDRDLTAPDAASTAAGWRETQISGYCEPCFDAITDEMCGDDSAHGED